MLACVFVLDCVACACVFACVYTNTFRNTIAERFYWKGMIADVRQLVSP